VKLQASVSMPPITPAKTSQGCGSTYLPLQLLLGRCEV